ncbi:Vitamin B12 transporter BtuB [Pseudoalteromonas holothuriae]|uniref:Vitamin B12 transporter BtuB n=1 Tax=Pseudoalteromonas holothuriae TaxID=2963714 RepID=A0A9W4R421_9GAMM|nr:MULTISPECIES: TonB-dependent receptor [unclassified Pseudoalteromonas]CAH9062145.1 Vitamin B12 transporter BtuB [Pseudoalteromonas sp. CIP111951]CAH9065729.1 Vitamin B12 transporter BtuB [Pseudoalteromonas sp. CIP111854]
MRHHRNLNTTLTKSIIAIAVAASSNIAFAEDESGANKPERIEVTGSRIKRLNFEAPSPTVVISAEDIKITGAQNVNDILTGLPQFADGFDSAEGNYSFGNAGLNVINLRNLGEARTLVLVNGKRTPSVTSDSQAMYTDIGTIPSSLVERVEIMTGGASAIYGSDAIAGVVNFILKKDFEGTKVNVHLGGTKEGGHSTRSLSVTHGFNFNEDDGNLTVAFDYLSENALKQSHRAKSYNYQRSVTNPNKSEGQPDKIWKTGLSPIPWGVPQTIFSVYNAEDGGYDWYDFDESSQDIALKARFRDMYDGWLVEEENGYDGTEWGHIEDPFERINLFGSLNYQFEDFDLSYDITLARTKSNNIIDPPFKRAWMQVSEVKELFDTPASITDNFDDEDWIGFHHTFYEHGGRKSNTQRDFISSNLTLSGVYNDDWFWDVNFTTGRSSFKLNSVSQLRHDRLTSKLQVVGECEAQGNCPTFSPFERQSDALLDYVVDGFEAITDTVNHALTVNLAGDVYELDAGMIQVSTGVDIRYEGIDFDPSELWSSGKLSSEKSPLDASRNIKEVYFEVLVPVLSDLPFAQQVDIEAAYRIADYSSNDSRFESSKLALNWALNDDVRMRSIFSQAVRAPQLEELYAAQSIGFSDVSDPCDDSNINGGPSDGRRIGNCALLGISKGWTSNIKTQRAEVRNSGNADLKEEKADTLTVGLVYTPTDNFLEGLTTSIDYYDIEIEDMISGFNGSSVMSNCVDLKANSVDNMFCDLIKRQANGDVEYVKPLSLNYDSARARGVDMELYYTWDALSFDLKASRIFERSTSTVNILDDTVETNNESGQLGDPKWMSSLVTKYKLEDLTLSWTFKFRQGGRWNDDSKPDYRDSDTPSHSRVHNLRADYQVSDTATVYLGLNNITDNNGGDHWTTSRGQINGWTILGRTGYIGVDLSF